MYRCRPPSLTGGGADKFRRRLNKGINVFSITSCYGLFHNLKKYVFDTENRPSAGYEMASKKTADIEPFQTKI
jgi:hypothetical protein